MGQHGKPRRLRFRAISLVATGLVVTLLQAPRSLPQQGEFRPQHPGPAVLAQRVRVIVPDVRGQTPENAQRILAKAGLSLGSTTYSSGPGAAGRVWRQNPAQNTVAWLGTSVNVEVVPQAKAYTPTHGDDEFRRAVPSLIGKTPEQAGDTLARAGLKLGDVTTDKGTGAEGTIFAQNPPAGQWVQALSSVDVRVVPQREKLSNGPDEFLWRIVPLLRGQTTKGAAVILQQSGLQMGSVSTGVAGATPGTIFGQEPQPNSKVRAGTAVNVWVAQAVPAKTVLVPNLLHLDPRTAQAVLQKSQLRFGKVRREESDSFIGSITAQSPEAGTQVEVGTAVSVTVAQERPPVTVPDVVKKDEATAAAMLSNAGLQMGAVAEQDSDESSGTVLSQNPPAGAQARTGSKVNVVVSHEILRTLLVMADDPNPEIGKRTKLHAHLVPDSSGFQYQFDFGDGHASKWLELDTATHTYQSAGPYKVQAAAMRGTTQVRSEGVEVLAREVEFNLLLEATPLWAKPQTDVTFQARVDRADIRPSYQFVFEDATTSKWSPESSAHRRYEKWGTYPVKVRARVAQGRIVESVVQVTVGMAPVPLLAAVAIGVVALGAGGFVYSGWSKFLRWIRAVPRMDAGQQHVKIASPEGWGEKARLRLVIPPGEQRIRWAQRQEPRKEGAHD